MRNHGANQKGKGHSGTDAPLLGPVGILFAGTGHVMWMRRRQSQHDDGSPELGKLKSLLLNLHRCAR